MGIMDGSRKGSLIPSDDHSQSIGSSDQDLTAHLRQELATAKRLLNLKSELGRLPASPRVQLLLDQIEDWFNYPERS